MSAFKEVMTGSLVFVVFMIIIPVIVFTADIVKNYYKKEVRRNGLGKVSGHHPKR